MQIQYHLVYKILTTVQRAAENMEEDVCDPDFLRLVFDI